MVTKEVDTIVAAGLVCVITMVLAGPAVIVEWLVIVAPVTRQILCHFAIDVGLPGAVEIS